MDVPIKYEWLNDDELFYYPFLSTRTLGLNMIIEEIKDGFNDVSFISSSLKIKQSAIKEWVKLNNIQSDYFDSLGVDAGQGSMSECLEIKEPKKKDDLYKAMFFYIEDYEGKNNKTPSSARLWEILKTANLEGWGLKYSENKIIKSTGKSTDYEAFEDRYNRYYPQ